MESFKEILKTYNKTTSILISQITLNQMITKKKTEMTIQNFECIHTCQQYFHKTHTHTYTLKFEKYDLFYNFF